MGSFDDLRPIDGCAVEALAAAANVLYRPNSSHQLSTRSRSSDVALGGKCYQYVSMTNLLVRDLPDDVHSTLQRRAEGAGQSLQQYLVAELTRLAARPTMPEILSDLSGLEGGRVGLATAVADLAGDRPAS